MRVPPGTYRLIDDVEMGLRDNLVVGEGVIFLYARPCRLRFGDEGVLIALLVPEKTEVYVVRDGKRIKYPR